MTDYIRTPDVNFDGLAGFAHPPHYHAWKDLRMHYLDVGPADAPVMLLLHGMPTWGFLYRDLVPVLVEAGYRCIVPDHLGFGRSDKPTDIHWYSIARHVEVLTSLIVTLDLQRVTLVCQDWGGPIGLAQAAMMPDRFERLVIMNTWLHHEGYEYTPAIRNWNRNWHEGGLFHRPCPDVGLLLVLSAGLAPREVIFPALTQGRPAHFDGVAAEIYRALRRPAGRGVQRAAALPAVDPLRRPPQRQRHRAGAALPTAAWLAQAGALHMGLCRRRVRRGLGQDLGRPDERELRCDSGCRALPAEHARHAGRAAHRRPRGARGQRVTRAQRGNAVTRAAG
jgi:pimeloyl-ACP methyl ester carboxylesterase